MGRLSHALSVQIGYNEVAKREFQLAAVAALRRLAKQMGLVKEQYSIRYNPGGIAVSGEATLHHENFYIQISSPIVGQFAVLYRICNGVKDYTGGPNHWATAADMDDTPTMMRKVLSVLGKV